MLYNPPSKWTEELLDELPFGEDDRYEWKFGGDFSVVGNDAITKFSENLATEIGAFSNSFGGTLFIGIADNKDRVGFQTVKGKTPIERWLENKIPSMFDLRLQHFRITRVELTPATQTQIGDGKAIIAIDVFDSELAPHQCVFDKKYYYRINSSSEPAPHHYLAFLWSRINSNMSRVATWWLREFLDPTIIWVASIQKFAHQNQYDLEEIPAGYDGYSLKYKLKLFDAVSFTSLASSDVGEYFLNTFPKINDELTHFAKNVYDFTKSFDELQSVIQKSSVFPRLLSNVGQIPITENDAFNRKNYNLKDVSFNVCSHLGLSFSNNPELCESIFIDYATYFVLSFNVSLPSSASPGHHQPFNLIKDLFNKLLANDEEVRVLANETKQIFSAIENQSKVLLASLKTDRMDLAKRYNATFGQTALY